MIVGSRPSYFSHGMEIWIKAAMRRPINFKGGVVTTTDSDKVILQIDFNTRSFYAWGSTAFPESKTSKKIS